MRSRKNAANANILQNREQYVLQHERCELLIKSGSGELVGVALRNFKIPIRAIFDQQTNPEILKSLI